MIEGKDITVITATIPGRESMLAECKLSAFMQTLMPFAHIVVCDANGKGVGTTRNSAIQLATTDWIAILDDDDLFYPDHLSELAAVAEDADVVYPMHDAKALENGQWIPRKVPWTIRAYNREDVRHSNYIPVTVLIRRQLLLETPFQNRACADWDVWNRLGERNARFKFVPKITWCYRRHPGNGSTGGAKW